MAKWTNKLKNYSLNFLYGRVGLPRKVNGLILRCRPDMRWRFSPQYDKPVADFFRSRIVLGDTCVSIGANLGIYPLQFAQWTGPSGRVFAYEPNPETVEVLRKHVALNGFMDQIKVLEKAISASPGKAVFHASATSGMSRLGEANPLLQGKTRPIEVEVTTLDQQFENTRVDALMMDIEGFEIAALRGAKNFLRNNLPKSLVVEMHPDAWGVAGTTRRDLEELLRECQVRVIPLSGQMDPMVEYGHISLEKI